MTYSSVLIFAHPGHELRVYNWLCSEQPIVFVLTDGSGSAGRSRLASTSKVLENAGAAPGSIYGIFSDRDLYRAILDAKFKCFLDLAEEFAVILQNEAISVVVGDAVEGYNPGHDVCRLVINAAVEVANARRGSLLQNFDFVLVGHPTVCTPDLADQMLRIELDNMSLERKVDQALAYSELKNEVEEVLAKHGKFAFATECLRPVVTPLQRGYLTDLPPYYERYGKQQVQNGLYQEVIRYQLHIQPLMGALDAWVASSTVVPRRGNEN